MRLLRIIASTDPAVGGPIEGVLRVGEALAKLGHIQEVASLDAPDAPYLARIKAPVHALGERAGTGMLPHRVQARLNYAPRAVPWLRAHRGDYDAVIVSGLWHYANLAARRALVGGPVPYVVFTHGMLDPWFNRAYPRKAALKRIMWLVNEGVMLRDADAVLFTSEEERLLARQSFRPYRVRERVVSYGTADAPAEPEREMQAFRKLLPGLGERRFLLFLSRIHPKKGCDLLVDAFAQAAAEHDIDLVIAGPDQTGWRAELEQQARARGIADRIHWPGMLQGDAKWGAFRASEAFVLPSHQENFGIVVAEAMACGRPVLITDKVNIWREILADGAGLVVPDTAEGVTRQLRDFLALSDEDRRAMGEKARASFLARFQIDQAALSLEAVLREAIGAGRRR